MKIPERMSVESIRKYDKAMDHKHVVQCYACILLAEIDRLTRYLEIMK